MVGPKLQFFCAKKLYRVQFFGIRVMHRKTVKQGHYGQYWDQWFRAVKESCCWGYFSLFRVQIIQWQPDECWRILQQGWIWCVQKYVMWNVIEDNSIHRVLFCKVLWRDLICKCFCWSNRKKAMWAYPSTSCGITLLV